MMQKISFFNSSSKPQTVVLEPFAADYTLVPGEVLVFVAEGVEGDFMFSADVRARDHVLVYTDGVCDFVSVFTGDGMRVDVGYNRHLMETEW
ncbi:hypothetical protein [Myxococcus sp. SDU36]|uniref:hypothetical protein n=1 Tax=Myxococcus sp. SDU36 TaxID=2831967 RepID=UPI0025428EFB|nr:hypothetical protein [Myxococcus sp. SDU36]WIG92583.1 hypothetical protein KGD87_18200 [Myxococcus sp. SDU36]